MGAPNSKRGYGSIDVQDFLDFLASGHSSIKKITTQKRGERLVIDVTTWQSNDTDQYGYSGTVHSNGTKAANEAGEKPSYFLNWKLSTEQQPVDATAQDLTGLATKAAEVKAKLNF